MKKILITLCLLTLVWAVPATADMKPLDNHVLDMIIAGELPDDFNVRQRLIQKSDANGAQVKASSYMTGDALNSVNFSDASVDASNNAINELKVLILKDGAQKEVRAVQLVNDIGGKVAFGSNVNVGGLDRQLSESGTGSHPFLNQSNIIIQSH